MNLYLISQTVNTDYDSFDSAVVVAPDADAARVIHPGSTAKYPRSIPAEDGEEWQSHDWVNDPLQVTVELIGVADARYYESAVICASFNAG